MTSTASRPVVPPRTRPPRLGQPLTPQARPPGAGSSGTGSPAAGSPGRLPLLADKLGVPRRALPVLRRRRVTELIDAAIRHRVTLVTGAAGTGKTVACAEWAA